MKQQIDVLGRLANVRRNRVQQLLAQLNYQRALCQRYRNNIQGLTAISARSIPVSTSLQRDNQQAYKKTLLDMITIQQRELMQAERQLDTIQADLQAAMRSEHVIGHVLDQKISVWQEQLRRGEQKLQDSMAAMSWSRAETW